MKPCARFISASSFGSDTRVVVTNPRARGPSPGRSSGVDCHRQSSKSRPHSRRAIQALNPCYWHTAAIHRGSLIVRDAFTVSQNVTRNERVGKGGLERLVHSERITGVNTHSALYAFCVPVFTRPL